MRRKVPVFRINAKPGASYEVLTEVPGLKEGKRLWKVYDDIIVENTEIQLKQLQSIRKEQKEWYITAEQALNLSIIDEIL